MKHAYQSSFFYIFFISILLSVACNSSEPPGPTTVFVFPGDANNDGAANHWDILRIGRLFGDNLLPRTNANPNWEAQAYTLPSSVSNAQPVYADCNGDGIIDFKDLSIVFENQWKTHNQATENLLETVSNNGIALTLQAIDSQGLPIDEVDISSGPQTIWLAITLGDAPSLYGLAFSIKFPERLNYNIQNFVIDTSQTPSPNNTFLDIPLNELMSNSDSILVRPNNNLINSFSFSGTSRINHAASGRVGCIIVVLDDINKKAETISAIFSIEEVRAIEADGNEVLIKPIGDTITVSN